MNRGIREIVIWAHSECGSTMALFREVKRLAGVPVTVVVRRSERGEWARQLREAQGQGSGEFADVVDLEWDGEEQAGRGIFAAHCGSGAVHVFSGYQVSATVRRLICEAHEKECRIAVYDEAPCEMCIGGKAWLKRLYYRFVLHCKVHKVTRDADLFLSASGRKGIGRLKRLGWAEGKIVPFGYASDFNCEEKVGDKSWSGRKDVSLRVLHTGIETPYRDVATLKRAVGILKGNGIAAELVCTGGNVPHDELSRLYGWADVFVACGLCEPWGMRVNDAIHAGLPVVVSNGMGAEWLVEQFGCGCIYEKGCAEELAAILQRFATDSEFRSRLLSGVNAAHETWSPEARAKVLLDVIKAWRGFI